MQGGSATSVGGSGPVTAAVTPRGVVARDDVVGSGRGLRWIGQRLGEEEWEQKERD